LKNKKTTHKQIKEMRRKERAKKNNNTMKTNKTIAKEINRTGDIRKKS
jgi:hypothetical protein